MKEGLTRLCHAAKEAFRPRGLDISGLHYFIPANFQRKREGILVCFDAFTNNPYFFGKSEYQNWRRIALLDLAYEYGYGAVADLCPSGQVTMDIHVRLRRPMIWSAPAFGNSPQFKNELVDASVDNKVRLFRLDELISGGEIEPGCTVDAYCQKYGIKHVLKHGLHCISPDSASVESFEAIAETVPLHSVLEIGAGVGICGAAALRRGIKDFTFFDSNRDVCDHLRREFPDFKVICADALELDFRRDWRAALIGIPYELMSAFLAERGACLEEWTDIVVFQSGSPAFFEFENNWIAGRDMAGWPWWRSGQTLNAYFPYVAEMSLDWQCVVLGCRYQKEFELIMESMVKRGFVPTSSIKYENIKI
jgi:hypothetical protein